MRCKIDTGYGVGVWSRRWQDGGMEAGWPGTQGGAVRGGGGGGGGRPAGTNIREYSHTVNVRKQDNTCTMGVGACWAAL